MREIHMGLHSKQAEKNVEKKIQEILRESRMTREEHNGALNVAKGMKGIGKT